MGRGKGADTESSPHRLRKALTGLLISTLTGLLILAAAETGFRMAGYGAGPAMYHDPRIGMRFHPNQTRTSAVRRRAPIELRLNSLGLRGPAPREVPGQPRVACIGDSFTFGWGVQGPDSYPSVLGQLLAQGGLADAEVLNFGVPGYNTWNELQLYRRVVRPHAPDVVVIGFYANDVKPDAGGTALDEVLLLRWLSRFTPALTEGLQRKVFARLEVGKPRVDETTRRQLRNWRKHQKKIIDQPSKAAWRDMWEACMAQLDTLVREVRADGAIPLIVFFPTPDQTREFDAEPTPPGGTGLVSTELEELVREHARASGTSFLTLLPDFATSETRPFGEVHHTHPSEHGYRISAERVAQAILSLGD